MGKPGRPPGIVKSEKIEVKIQPKLKKLFQYAVKQEGSNASVAVCELISKYLREKGFDTNEI